MLFPFSMNALDDLEAALGDSMDSLNCSSEDESPLEERPEALSAPPVKVTVPAPLLVDDDDDENSDEENTSLYSFGSTADLDSFTSPDSMPDWLMVRRQHLSIWPIIAILVSELDS